MRTRSKTKNPFISWHCILLLRFFFSRNMTQHSQRLAPVTTFRERRSLVSWAMSRSLPGTVEFQLFLLYLHSDHIFRKTSLAHCHLNHAACHGCHYSAVISWLYGLRHVNSFPREPPNDFTKHWAPRQSTLLGLEPMHAYEFVFFGRFKRPSGKVVEVASYSQHHAFRWMVISQVNSFKLFVAASYIILSQRRLSFRLQVQLKEAWASFNRFIRYVFYCTFATGSLRLYSSSISSYVGSSTSIYAPAPSLPACNGNSPPNS